MQQVANFEAERTEGAVLVGFADNIAAVVFLFVE